MDAQRDKVRGLATNSLRVIVPIFFPAAIAPVGHVVLVATLSGSYSGKKVEISVEQLNFP
jgi:hypothetical protein